MYLSGVKYHYAFDQSGVRNFLGQGWPYHRYFKLIPGFSFNNCSFVGKTGTLLPRRGKEFNEPGNMPLEPDAMTPTEFLPRCIHVSLRSWIAGAAINAVGLAGPGLMELLRKPDFIQPGPSMISLTAVGPTIGDRLQEIEQMALMLASMRKTRRLYAIQLNISCPNKDHGKQQIADIIKETKLSLMYLRRYLGRQVALLFKINAEFPIWAAVQIIDNENCDGVCNSNTIPWNEVPEVVRMHQFGTNTSPLEKYGGGGVSGSYLLPLVVKWLRDARRAGITKPIIAGGGILKPSDVETLAAHGASAIAIGSVAFLRPWRVQAIIDRANELGKQGHFYRH